MTNKEIKQMVNTCNNYHNCGGCPYNPKDISRFIGDSWKGGCPNYDNKLVYAMGKGYGKISKYKAEIKRLKDDYSKLQEQFAKYQTASDKEIVAQVKQAKIDLLKELIDGYGRDYISPVGLEKYKVVRVLKEIIEEIQIRSE